MQLILGFHPSDSFDGAANNTIQAYLQRNLEFQKSQSSNEETSGRTSSNDIDLSSSVPYSLHSLTGTEALVAVVARSHLQGSDPIKSVLPALVHCERPGALDIL